MINGMPIFYSSKTGSGLEPIQTKKGKGLEPVQTKKGKGCNKKFKNKKYKGSGHKINLIFFINIL